MRTRSAPCSAGWRPCARTCARRQIQGQGDATIASSVGLAPTDLEQLYRLLAVAKYEDRYVVPPAHRETADRLLAATDSDDACSVDAEGRFERTAQSFRGQLVQLDPRHPAPHAPAPPRGTSTPPPQIAPGGAE